MTLSAVATRYANALADVVVTPGSALTPDAALKELRAFEGAMQASHELAAALATPAVSASRKKAVIGRLAGILGLSKITLNFLFVLADHRRTGLLRDIVSAFQAAMDERNGVVPAEIAAAAELTQAERAELTAELEKITGKRVRMAFVVDPSLIGGVIAKVGSTVYDGSVRGALHSLELRLGAEA